MNFETEGHAGNTGFASGGVTCELRAFCFYSSAMLVDSLVLRIPHERQAQKRNSTFQIKKE
jgi:hypothetical protein